MSGLSRAARDEILAYGVTIAGYTRHWFGPEGKWHGDSCGCTDDRCRGYHHDAGDECGCLAACLERYWVEALATSWFELEVRGRGPIEWVHTSDGSAKRVGQWPFIDEARQAQANWARHGYHVTLVHVQRAVAA